MKVLTSLAVLALSAVLWTCSNIDDATLSKRKSYIHLYEGPSNITAADMIAVEGGYLLLGNMLDAAGSPVTTIIRTDAYGNQIGEMYQYPGGSGKVIKPFSNDTFTGYLVIGDSIKIDPNVPEVSDIEVTSARILIIPEDLNPMQAVSLTFKDDVNTVRKTDIRGIALTVKEDGGVIVLITYEEYNSTVRPWVISLRKNDLTAVDWEYKFDLLVRDYVAGKSIHHHNEHTFFASSLLRQQGNFDEKYVSIIKVKDYLTEDNSDYLGESLNKSISANEIQPAKSFTFGFGVIGTISETDGTKKNMFFARLKASGGFDDPPTVLYLDPVLSETTGDESAIEDTGESLCSTSDGGFVLAGTMQTSSVSGSTIGKGERDIFLVKIDYTNQVSWTKIIGGAGDEVVSTVRQSADGGLLIYGTNTIGGYTSLFLISTDKNGELKN